VLQDAGYVWDIPQRLGELARLALHTGEADRRDADYYGSVATPAAAAAGGDSPPALTFKPPGAGSGACDPAPVPDTRTPSWRTESWLRLPSRRTITDGS
jgi:hypothetical protein